MTDQAVRTRTRPASPPEDPASGPECRDNEARDKGVPRPVGKDLSPSSEHPLDVKRRRGTLRRIGGGALKLLATLLVLGAAGIGALLIWDYYVIAPWTRDGRVRVQVASVAPQVSGQITEVRIVDNQYVRKGDVLYVIDRFDYQNALDQARTQVDMKAADFQVKSMQAERRQHLSNLATSPEQQQQYVGDATQAKAGFEAAQAQLAMAEINLDRTSVRSPVNGFITNFQMRVGDYARSGSSDISVIDADSYWIDGYFEETKMAHVCVGDRAEAQLMGYAAPILGEVDSVTRGIAVSDAASSTQGLPDVDAVYTWVRLAQRVPVRIRITQVPPGIPLVSGMTATVSVREANDEIRGSGWQQKLDTLRDRISTLLERTPPRADCVPSEGFREGRTVTIPTPEPSPSRTPTQINPGLTPSMTEPPRVLRR